MSAPHPAPAGHSSTPAGLDALFPSWPETRPFRHQRHPRLVGAAVVISLFWSAP